ncbi:MAG TPA: SDR family NAD(P)-dependent oxidoreductase, partial [Acidimicrobiales bacterium]|nr:SDR family NAD(P)-dependent oxidoreductase [Acidimicrobiales bacterium]
MGTDYRAGRQGSGQIGSGQQGSGAFDLTGKVAVVTGGSGALGRAVATGLVAAGARVAVLSRTMSAVEQVAKDLAGDGEPAAMAVAADVTSEPDVQAARDAVLEQWGRLDILVNGAGGNQPAGTVPPGGTFFDVEMEGFRRVLDINLMGTVLPSSVMGRAMSTDEGGAIV